MIIFLVGFFIVILCQTNFKKIDGNFTKSIINNHIYETTIVQNDNIKEDYVF